MKKAWKKFRKLLLVLTSPYLSHKTHGYLYSSCVWSAMLHASETWPLTKTNLQRLGHGQTNMQYQVRGCGHGKVRRSLDISAHNNFGPCQFRPITKSALTISAHKCNNVSLVCLSIIDIIRSAYL